MLYASFTLLSSLWTPATAEESTKQDSQESDQSNLSLGARHIRGISGLADPVSIFSAAYSQALEEEKSLSISQSLTQNYLVDEKDQEFQLTDTQITLSTLVKGGDNSNYQLSSSLSLPISDYARYHGIYSRLGLGASTSWQLDDNLKFSLGSGLSYYLNRYKTSRFKDGYGGDPLPHWGLRLSYGLSYSLDKTTLSSGATYSRIERERVSGGAIDGVDDLPSETYNISLSASYQVQDHLSAGLGIGHGKSIDGLNRTDWVVYDEDFSTYFFSIQSSL